MINPFVLASNRISCAIDNCRDKKFCGQKLGVFVPTPFAKTHGATGSQSASYPGLDVVLKDLVLTPDDSFIDIGCGKGRVLAYLLSKGYTRCRLTGVEINPQVAAIARSWSSKYKNVEIVEGDAFGLDFNDYKVLFMYRPMDRDAFFLFINLLEMTLTHEVKIYYYADGESGFYLTDRAGWHLLDRHDIYHVHGRYIHTVPQSYSIWKYTPAG